LFDEKIDGTDLSLNISVKTQNQGLAVTSKSD